MKITTKQLDHARTLAGRLPARGEIRGMVTDESGQESALVLLPRGLYIAVRDGVASPLDQHAVHVALEMAERGKRPKNYSRAERARRRRVLAENRKRRWM